MASTSDSKHFTDKATGIKVHILTGPANFTSWMRDLKSVARCKGIWSFIDPKSVAEIDREIIHPKPVRPTKLDRSRFEALGGETNEVRAALRKEFEAACSAYEIDILEYQLDVSEYEKQQERLREARLLLLLTMTPSIRQAVIHYSVNDGILASDVLIAAKALCQTSDIRTAALRPKAGQHQGQ